MLTYNKIKIEKETKSGNSFSIALLSDLHMDSRKYIGEKLKRKLEDVEYLMVFGDIADWILHNDERYQPENDAKYPSRDDFLIERIEYVANGLSKLGPKVLFLSMGNHEAGVLKRHGVNPVSLLADQLQCQHGGYAGIVDLMLRAAADRWLRCRIGFHHGRWGGVNDKGYSGAKRFFDTFDRCDVCVFGHNHAARLDAVTRLTVENGTYNPYHVPIINCSSQVSSVQDGSVTSYEVVHGYSPAPNVVNILKLIVRCTHGYWFFDKEVIVRM